MNHTLIDYTNLRRHPLQTLLKVQTAITNELMNRKELTIRAKLLYYKIKENGSMDHVFMTDMGSSILISTKRPTTTPSLIEGKYYLLYGEFFFDEALNTTKPLKLYRIDLEDKQISMFSSKS
jgi:hypothetical protein